jgi:hypothetical protein
MSVAQRTFDVLERLLNSNGSDIKGAMQTLIAACAEERPHADWSRLEALDYAAGAASIHDWISRALADEMPPPQTDGLWFGLFTPVYDGEAQADLYLHASTFDADDDDWPCTPQRLPNLRYAHSVLLRDVYRIGYEDKTNGLAVDAEYPGVLGFAALAVATWARAAAAADASIVRTAREVFVGFDGGDQIRIGRLHSSGLTRTGSP